MAASFLSVVIFYVGLVDKKPIKVKVSKFYNDSIISAISPALLSNSAFMSIFVMKI